MSNEITKNTKRAIIDDLCKTIEVKKSKMKTKGGNGLPYGYLTNQVNGVRVVCPSITCDNIYNELRQRGKRKADSISAGVIIPVTPAENQVSTVATETALTICDNSPKKVGGRPAGSTCK